MISTNILQKNEITSTIVSIRIDKQDEWVTMDVMCDMCKKVSTHAIGYFTEDNPIETVINFSKMNDTRCCEDYYFTPTNDILKCNSEFNFSNIKLPKPRQEGKID